jgi:hypothetical protein
LATFFGGKWYVFLELFLIGVHKKKIFFIFFGVFSASFQNKENKKLKSKIGNWFFFLQEKSFSQLFKNKQETLFFSSLLIIRS